jgi:hypothetical protein
MKNTQNKKQRIDEGFDSLRHIDNDFNRAAGILEESTETIESRLKKKLFKESTDKKMMKEYFAPGEFLEDEPMDDFEDDEFGEAILDEEIPGFEDDNLEGIEDLDLDRAEEGMEDLNEYNEIVPKSKSLEPTSTHEMEDEMSLEEGMNLIESLVESIVNPLDNSPEGEDLGAAPEMPVAGGMGEDLGGEGEGMGEDLGGEMPGAEGMEGMDDMGAEGMGEEGMDDMGGGMGSMPSMGGSGGMGSGLDSPLGGKEEQMNAASTNISQPQDIDSLIANMVPSEETLTENKQLNALGYKDLKDKDLVGNKIKMENKISQIKKLKESIEKETGKKVIFENEDLGNGAEKPTTLPNKFKTPTSVQGASEHKKVEHADKAKVVSSVAGFKLVELGEEKVQGKASKVSNEKGSKMKEGSFEQVKAESTHKSKALINLAEKHVMLEEKSNALILENYKLKKVNSLLTALPMLQESAKKALIERFDSCKTQQEAAQVYKDVVSVIKESNVSETLNKRKLTESVIKSQKSNVSFLSEGTEQESDDQARKDMLMGIGGEETYGRSGY